MHVSSFMTMIAAEPSIEPLAATPSKSSGQSSISAAVSMAADAPPGMTALTALPPFMPRANASP